jgi:hypothetical protein
MSDRRAWPERSNPIAKVRFALMTGFDPKGQPVHARGTVDSVEERKLVQAILEPLLPLPRSITSVAMGEVTIELEDGREITLRPMFRPSLDAYRDLFFVGEWQYPMPAKLAELLEQWRKAVANQRG